MDHIATRNMIMLLNVCWMFYNQMTNMQSAYSRLVDRRSLMDERAEKLKKAVLVLGLANFFINQMMNTQTSYLRQVEWRLCEIPKKVIPRNLPEPRTIMYYERVVLRLSASTFRSHFRLTKTTFVNLCILLGPLMAPNVEGGRRGRPNTPIEKQILPVLWLLATPESYRSVADRFDISKGTLFLFFNRCVDELNNLSSAYIRWPTKAEIPNIRKQFFKIVYFDDCVIGAIDGTYIVIPAPNENPEVYRTRKCNFALTLQAICLPTMRFTSCYVGFPGSVSDRRIFENSPIYNCIKHNYSHYFPNREYIIGDKAYPVLEWIQAPFVRRYVLNDAQEHYNTLLSSTRQVIERAFALLFGRFRRLKMLDMKRDCFIPKTVIACCVLHNMALPETKFEDFIKEGMAHVHLFHPRNNDLARSYIDKSGSQRRGDVAARLHRQQLLT